MPPLPLPFHPLHISTFPSRGTFLPATLLSNAGVINRPFPLWDLQYADDALVLSYSSFSATRLLRTLQSLTSDFGLELNLAKYNCFPLHATDRVSFCPSATVLFFPGFHWFSLFRFHRALQLCCPRFSCSLSWHPNDSGSSTDIHWPKPLRPLDDIPIFASLFVNSSFNLFFLFYRKDLTKCSED